MNVTYSDRVKQASSEYPLVQKATKRLEEILGQNAESASAEWDRAQDEVGRAVFTLRLKDSTGEASGNIYPDELNSSPMTTVGLRLIWGDILKARTHKLLDGLSEGDA